MAESNWKSGLTGEQVRERFTQGAPSAVISFCEKLNDENLKDLVTDLGGHNIESLLDAFAQCDAVTDRPSVVFHVHDQRLGSAQGG